MIHSKVSHQFVVFYSFPHLSSTDKQNDNFNHRTSPAFATSAVYLAEVKILHNCIQSYGYFARKYSQNILFELLQFIFGEI